MICRYFVHFIGRVETSMRVCRKYFENVLRIRGLVTRSEPRRRLSFYVLFLVVFDWIIIERWCHIIKHERNTNNCLCVHFVKRQMDVNAENKRRSQWGGAWNMAQETFTKSARKVCKFVFACAFCKKFVHSLSVVLNKPGWLASLNSILPKVCNGKFC